MTKGFVFRILLVGGCFLYVIWGIALDELWRSLQSMAPVGVGLTLLFILLNYILVGLRLKVISREHIKLATGINAGIFGIGMNNIFPAKLGEAAKTLYLSRAAEVGLAQSLGWVFWERFSDLNLLALLVLVAVLTVSIGGFAWPLFLLAGLLWGGLFLLARVGRFVRLVQRLVMLPRLRILVGDLADHLRGGLNVRFLVRVALSALGVWVLYFLQYVLFLRLGAGLDLGIMQLLVVFVLAAGGMALPALPSGVGVYQAAVVVGL